MLVAEERARLKRGMIEQIKHGCTKERRQECAACDQDVNVHKHKVTWAQATALAVLVDMYEDTPGYHHISDIKRQTRFRSKKPELILSHFSVMAKWSLIEDEPNFTDPEKRTSGMWRPTQRGIDFVYNQYLISKYLWTFDNRIMYESPETTSIKGATGEQFSWPEMQGIKAGTYVKPEKEKQT